jgi:hypothetical protein
MRRATSFVCLSLAGLCLALTAAGCGGSSAVSGPGPAPVASGRAVLQGSVRGAGEGLQVGVVGSSLTAPVDEEGQFALSGLPSGSVTLRFEGAGVDARLSVDNLQDGQVTSIAVKVAGGVAQLDGVANCAPTVDTFFTGTIEQIAGPRLSVSGRTVDASEIRKVWRGEKRIQLADLQQGEKVKVWGTLRGDGVVLAEEIAALTSAGSTGQTWVSFSGSVQSIGEAAADLAARCVDPTLVVNGVTVETGEATKFRSGDGSPIDPGEIKVGSLVAVEGWKKNGTVRATQVTLQR